MTEICDRHPAALALYRVSVSKTSTLTLCGHCTATRVPASMARESLSDAHPCGCSRCVVPTDTEVDACCDGSGCDACLSYRQRGGTDF